MNCILQTMPGGADRGGYRSSDFGDMFTADDKDARGRAMGVHQRLYNSTDLSLCKMQS